MTAAKEVFKPFAEHWHRLPVVDMGILEITEGRRDSHLPGCLGSVLPAARWMGCPEDAKQN